MDNPKNTPYLSRILALALVDKNVDNPRFLVDKLWISAELSTGRSYPQFYPQVYPQVVLVSVGTYGLLFLFGAIFIHRVRELSTVSVDN